MDYGRDTSVHDGERTMSDIPMPEKQPLMATLPLSELSATLQLSELSDGTHPTPSSDDSIITNPLVKQQRLAIQQEESARRKAQMVATL